jgi:hypothetical protein
MEVSGCEPKPKEDIYGWPELRDQIKADLEAAHKQNASLTQINELLILHNFAMLQIRTHFCKHADCQAMDRRRRHTLCLPDPFPHSSLPAV